LIEAGVVRSKASGSLGERVKEIHDGVADIIATLKPEVLAIEELYSHYDRPTTAILMGHARGVIILAAADAGIPVVSYRATQIKKTITGNGHAAKWQMQEAVRRELNLQTLPEPPDVADALAIAMCHCYLTRHEMRAAE
jgi:crossover junction endodeoxyribonuclease RuvC